MFCIRCSKEHEEETKKCGLCKDYDRKYRENNAEYFKNYRKNNAKQINQQKKEYYNINI